MGSIKKQADGTYRARYRDLQNRDRDKRGFRTKKLAQAWLDEKTASVATGIYVKPKAGRIRFGVYADQWLGTKVDVRESTMGNIRGRLRKHAKPFFEGMPLQSVRPEHARAFVADLSRKGLAPSTIKGVVLTTGQVFAQAVDDGIITRSPLANVALPPDASTDEKCFLSAEQVNLLAEALDDRYRTAIYLAAYGGLRAGELWALKSERVDINARTIEVAASMSEAGGLHVGPTKTGKRRTITIPNFLASMIADHLRRYPSKDGFVFTAAGGGPMRHRNFMRRDYQPATIRAELPRKLRFHDLRHTCAALLIAKGRHLEEVKSYLGHSSIRVTSDRYGHLFPEARAATADALEAAFTAASGVSRANRGQTL